MSGARPGGSVRVYRREEEQEEQEQEQEQEASLTLEWSCTGTVRSVAVLDSAANLLPT